MTDVTNHFTVGTDTGRNAGTFALLESYQGAAAKMDGSGGVEHPDMEKATETVQTVLNRRVEEIRHDESLDGTQKLEAIRSQWDSAVETMETVTKSYGLLLEKGVEKQEGRLFFVPQGLRDSTRSAYELVSGAAAGFDSGTREGMEQAEANLERYWSRAKRTDDTALQHAVGHVALERGLEDLRAQYLAGRPDQRTAFEKYSAAQRRRLDWNDNKSRGVGMLSGRFAIAKPAELLTLVTGQ